MAVIGVDIGGTKCAVLQGDLGGHVLRKEVIQTENYEQTLNWILSKVNEFKNSDSDVVGISCGGPLDSARGVICSPPNLPGWDDVPIVALVLKRTGLKSYLVNDANAGALAELYYGNGKGCKHLLFLTFGTGLGCGLILNGQLYEGASGDAGEVGHIRLAKEGPVGYHKAGSFEGFCSGSGITKLANFLGFAQLPKTTKELSALYYAGDTQAQIVFKESAEKLGQGLSLLIDILNPEKILLGGVYSRCRDIFEPIMLSILKKECLERSLSHCQVLPAGLDESIGDLATLAIVRYHTEKSSS